MIGPGIEPVDEDLRHGRRFVPGLLGAAAVSLTLAASATYLRAAFGGICGASTPETIRDLVAALGLLLGATSAARSARQWRMRLDPAGHRRRALAAGRCPVCDYVIRGLPEGRCPECGEAWSEAERRDPSWLRERARRRTRED